MRNTMLTVESDYRQSTQYIVNFVIATAVLLLVIQITTGCSDDASTSAGDNVYKDTVNAFPVDLYDMGDAGQGCGFVLRHYIAAPDTANVAYYLLAEIPELMLEDPDGKFGATLLTTRDSTVCTNERELDSLGSPVKVWMKRARVLLLVKL